MMSSIAKIAKREEPISFWEMCSIDGSTEVFNKVKHTLIMKAPLLSNGSQMDVKRKQNWTVEETVMLVEEVEAKKEIIKGKFSPTLTSRHKKEVWKQIADSINASFSSTIRSPQECEKKWYNVLSKAHQEISTVKKATSGTGGGPAPKPLSAVAEVVLHILGENNATISGVGDCQDAALLKLQAVVSNVDENTISSPHELPVELPGPSGIPSPAAGPEPRLPEPPLATATPRLNPDEVEDMDALR
ncbi:myb/SANT-like DNA-binding domain-containing protein 4 [Anguilla rostrata]|uniref:myb/SANT-like DNA-binding domain-containing protein 4 n=1 Tax=Anguilla rostrata TaxID=7938 RepID=UPI0030CF312F